MGRFDLLGGQNNLLGVEMPTSLHGGGGEVLQKNLYGDAQSRLQNFEHLYTSKSVIL